jgi:hypothetical protein
MACSGPAAERGSIVLGWLTRLTLMLTFLGLIAFEVLSIVVTRVQIQDDGFTIGQAAISSYQQHGNPALALAAAQEAADEASATVKPKTFVVHPDGSVSFELMKTARTLLLYRVDHLAGYAEVTQPVLVEPLEQSGAFP